jgi:hypothetical protein
LLLNDIEHLPKIVTDIDGIRDVLLAIEPEIIQLREDISNFNKELYVKTTNLFIERWERDFGLKYDASLTLQQRRQRILNKLARKKVLNWDNLRLLIKNNISENVQFSVSNKAPEYSFKIFVNSNDTDELYNALTAAKPAYLTFSILYHEFGQRYCGTFYCGTNPL